MPILSWRTAMCAAAIHLSLLTFAAHAVVGGAAVPDSDHQYDAVGLVFGASGSCGGGVAGSCTLVGPDIVMMARHSVAGNGLPAAGSRSHRIRFRRGVSGAVTNSYTTDCAAPFQEIYIAEYWITSDLGVDMVLGRLESRPVGIQPIPALPTYVPTGGETITLAGWGYSGLCLQSGEAWALRTKTAALPGNPRWSACCFDYNNAAIGTGCASAADAARWAIGNLHDSGSPILVSVTVNGRTEPRVIGIVQTQSSGITVAAWNRAGGVPVLPIASNCLGDFNQTGAITLQDLFDFLSAYFARGAADINRDGQVSLQDVFDYLTAYFTNCS